MVADDILNLTFFPKGTILTFNSTAWSNASAAFKTIWKICDGQNGTPDLSGRFLRGGASSGVTGGADSVTLTAGHVPIPAHTHTFSGTSSGGTSHTHAYSGTSSGGSSHTHAYSGTSSGGSSHSHGLSGNTGTDGSHGHTFTGTNQTGTLSIVSGGNSGSGVFGTSTAAGTSNHISAGVVGTDPCITFSMTPSGSNSTHDGHAHSLSGSTGGETAHTHTYSGTSGGETAHTHTYSGTSGGETAHTHTYSGTTSNYEGVAATAAVPTVPAYYQVIYIMKVA
jgi:hypothetical protein